MLDEQERQPGEKFGKIAEDMGLITDEQLAQALAEQMGMQVINLSDAKFRLAAGEVTETMASAVPRDPGPLRGQRADRGHERSPEPDDLRMSSVLFSA